jgi:hypothetical protein
MMSAAASGQVPDRTSVEAVSAAFASASADMKFASVVLVGRKQQAAPPASRRSASLPFSQEAAAVPLRRSSRDVVESARFEANSLEYLQQPPLVVDGSYRPSPLPSPSGTCAATDFMANATSPARESESMTATDSLVFTMTGPPETPRSLKTWQRRKHGGQRNGNVHKASLENRGSLHAIDEGVSAGPSSYTSGPGGGKSWISALAAAMEDDYDSAAAAAGSP